MGYPIPIHGGWRQGDQGKTVAGGIVGRAGAAARGADGRGSWYWRLGVPSRLAWPGVGGATAAAR